MKRKARYVAAAGGSACLLLLAALPLGYPRDPGRGAAGRGVASDLEADDCAAKCVRAAPAAGAAGYPEVLLASWISLAPAASVAGDEDEAETAADEVISLLEGSSEDPECEPEEAPDSSRAPIVAAARFAGVLEDSAATARASAVRSSWKP